MKNTVAIVLVAGKGTRMQSDLPKVLHPLLGQPMIFYTACLLQKLGLNSYFVVGVGREKVKQALREFNVRYITQKEQLGTGHAVKIALPKIIGYNNALIMHGDSSAFFQPETVNGLISQHYQERAIFSILTVCKKNSDGSGSILRDKNGQVIKNSETKNKDLANCEVNAGMFCVDFLWLKKNISFLKIHPDSGEYYFPDMIEIAFLQKKKIITTPLKRAWEKTHINTLEQLKRANALAKRYLGI